MILKGILKKEVGRIVIISARMAELVDAQDLKSCSRNTMPVRFRLRAFYKKCVKKDLHFDVKIIYSVGWAFFYYVKFFIDVIYRLENLRSQY